MSGCPFECSHDSPVEAARPTRWGRLFLHGPVKANDLTIRDGACRCPVGAQALAKHNCRSLWPFATPDLSFLRASQLFKQSTHPKQRQTNPRSNTSLRQFVQTTIPKYWVAPTTRRTSRPSAQWGDPELTLLPPHASHASIDRFDVATPLGEVSPNCSKVPLANPGAEVKRSLPKVSPMTQNDPMSRS